jgi:hypothetical protein
VADSATPGDVRDARRRTALALLKAADICAVAGDRAGERQFLGRARDLAGFTRAGARALLRLVGRALSRD